MLSEFAARFGKWLIKDDKGFEKIPQTVKPDFEKVVGYLSIGITSLVIIASIVISAVF